MRKVGLFVGIGRYADEEITPLLGAANDAIELAALFKRNLGFETHVITHEQLLAGEDLKIKVDGLVEKLGADDLFVFYFAGHGRSPKKETDAAQPRQAGGANNEPAAAGRAPERQVPKDQVFLLPQAKLARVDAGKLDVGVITLQFLKDYTDRPGLRRAFVFDACRDEPEVAKADTRSGQSDFAFDGELIYRNVVFGKSAERGGALPPVILNSCQNTQRAVELRKQNRGLFSLALDMVIGDLIGRREPVVLNDRLVKNLTERMHQLLPASAQIGLRPCLVAQAEMTLFDPAAAVVTGPDTRQARLRSSFDEQLAKGQINAPAGRCARDTLSQLAVLGTVDDTVLDDLSQRLQAAVDREHDDKLIQRARRTRSAADYDTYLAESRLREHVAEAEAAVAGHASAREAEQARLRDAAAWQAAAAADTEEAFSGYLVGPAGVHLAEAQARLDALRRAAAARRIEEIKARFEHQLTAGRLLLPLGDCARDTLARSLELGADETWMQAARQRLADALAAQQQEERRRDDDAYAEAAAASTSAAIEKYLRVFPAGAYRAQAQEALAELRRAAAEMRKRDDAAFAHAEQSNTAQAYQDYIDQWSNRSAFTQAYQHYFDQWPQGAHADKARVAIRGIVRDDAVFAAADTEADLLRYEAEFPQGRHRHEKDERLRLLREAAAKSAELAARQAQEAQAWAKVLEAPSEARMTAFLDAFADGPFAAQARDMLAKLRAEREAQEARDRQRSEADAAAWKKANRLETVEAYRNYLAQFPDGRRAADAQLAISEADGAAWKKASRTNTGVAYRRYLEEFPEGKRAYEAARRITEIEAEATKAAAAAAAARQAAAAKPAPAIKPSDPHPWPPWKRASIALLSVMALAIVAAITIPERKVQQVPEGTATSSAPPASPAAAAPDPADVQAYLRAREAIVGSAWWSAPFKGAAPPGHEDWLARGARLAKAGYPAALFDQGWATAFGRGVSKNPVAAVDHFLRWLALPRDAVGDPTGAQRTLAVDAVTETLIEALREGPAARDWSPVVARLNSEPKPGYPAELWRGLLAECTLAGGGMDEARRAYQRVVDAASATGSDGWRDYARGRLKTLGQGCR
jgi:hypothetical protein